MGRGEGGQGKDAAIAWADSAVPCLVSEGDRKYPLHLYLLFLFWSNT